MPSGFIQLKAGFSSLKDFSPVLDPEIGKASPANLVVVFAIPKRLQTAYCVLM
jgi:hypothetical protein